MPKVSIIVAGLAALAAPASAQRAASFAEPVKKFIVADQPVIQIKDVRIVDVANGAAGDGQSIVIENGRIIAIGASLADRPGARVIDGKGRTVVPGLVLMHEHLASPVTIGKQSVQVSNPYIPQVMLAYGVTTARTAGGFDLGSDIIIKDRIAEGSLAGPDLNVTLFVGGPEGRILTVDKLRDADAARRDVAYWASRGAGSIKLFFLTPPELSIAAIDEAKKRRMSVAGHLCATHLRTAVPLGLETLEHGLWAAYDLVPEAKEGACNTRTLQPAMMRRLAELQPDDPRVEKLLGDLLANGVAITPTLSVREAHLCAPSAPPRPQENALLSRPGVVEPPASCSAFGVTWEIEQKGNRFLNATAKKFHDMGGTLLAGTDQGKVAGAGAPDELEALAALGLTPVEVLKIATLNGARALRRDSDIGSIEVGKRADLLLVDGRPDQDISAMRRVDMVFKDGIAYDPEKLRADAKGAILN